MTRHVKLAIAAALLAAAVAVPSLAAPPPGRRTGTDTPKCWQTPTGWQCLTPPTTAP